MEDRNRRARLVDMFANPHLHQELHRVREAELAAQARHADLIRLARAGQLQPELESGRRHERRSRLSALRRGRPAMV
jgi:hypothetical protein